MASKKRELTALDVKRLEEPGFYRVGGVSGLYLKVSPGGSRSWILRATVGIKRRDIGLGGFPDVSLAMARESAREARDKIRQGVDPAEERKAAKRALAASQLKAITFREAALRCHAARSAEFRSTKHRNDWINSLEIHAFPLLGNLPVSEVELAHVLAVLEPIWATRTETATRVRQRLESVLTWAGVSGYRSGENPARWQGHLKELLPAPSKIAKVEHHPALPWTELGAFMVELRQRKGLAPRALEFAILTAARSGEVRGATWDEIDLQALVWTIPAERIKAGKEHKVPLSEPAVALLKALPRFAGSPYVFPSTKGGQLSDVALLAVMRRMGLSYVPHGFRSCFRDWCAERTNYPREVAEMALAHAIGDKVEAAYRRGALFEKRARLMRDWAKFCGTVRGAGEVTSMRGHRQ